MRNKILAAMTRWVRPGDHVICALSGGADSVAMTHCLFSLQQELGITLSACHFNHRLRQEESDGDENFCRAFCRDLGLELTLGSEDVAQRSAQTGESLEEAARVCRYAFFSTLPGLIATAHTADDQTETVLLNLLRGTGLKGLGGIPPRRDRYLRPMLQVSREEVLAYLTRNGLLHREDATNAEDDCVRNRLRHHVVPLLKKENPNLTQTMQRMTRLLRQDEALLERQAEALLQGDPESGWLTAPLLAAPEVLQSRALRKILARIPKLSQAHISAGRRLLESKDPSARVTLPGGWLLAREYDRLCLTRNTGENAFAPVLLHCPGKVFLPELGITFRASVPLPTPILIRPRRSGDCIRLPGGTKTVKKLLIDRKIPAAKRQNIPILEQEGRILCVWGVAGEAPGITIEKE